MKSAEGAGSCGVGARRATARSPRQGPVRACSLPIRMTFTTRATGAASGGGVAGRKWPWSPVRGYAPQHCRRGTASAVPAWVGTFEPMAVLLESHAAFLAHETGPGHPERPARLQAVLAGVDDAGVHDAIAHVTPRPATRAELERVHPAVYLDALERF